MKVAIEAAVNVEKNTISNTANIVGPCDSRRWKPELDIIEFGLSIRTLGSTAAVGTDGF